MAKQLFCFGLVVFNYAALQDDLLLTPHITPSVLSGDGMNLMPGFAVRKNRCERLGQCLQIFN